MAYLEELLPEFRDGAKIRVLGWDDGKYYYFKNGIIYNQYNHEIKELSLSLLFSNFWEIYQKPIDWDYIIKNKCLCWFGVIGKEKQRVGTVKKIAEFRGHYTYYIDEDNGFSVCHPVRRDEVTFYEEKEHHDLR